MDAFHLADSKLVAVLAVLDRREAASEHADRSEHNLVAPIDHNLVVRSDEGEVVTSSASASSIVVELVETKLASSTSAARSIPPSTLVGVVASTTIETSSNDAISSSTIMDCSSMNSPSLSLLKPKSLSSMMKSSIPTVIVAPDAPAVIDPPISYEIAIQKCRKALKNPKSLWSQRSMAMDSISDHLKSSLSHPPSLLSDITALRGPIAKQLDDARSAVVRSVCRLISNIAAALKHSFEDMAVFLLPGLFSKLYITIRVISFSADQCIRALIEALKPCPNLIPKFVIALTDSHSAARRAVAGYLKTVLEDCRPSPSNLGPFAPSLASALAVALTDADPDVRKLARSALHSYTSLFPDVALPIGVEAFDLKHRPISSSPPLSTTQDHVENSAFVNLLA